MQELIERVFTDPTFVWVGFIMVVMLTLGIFKKLYKLVMIIVAVFIIYVGYFYYTGEKPIKAVFLRTYKIPQIEISLEPEFEGCKSWIELNLNQDSGQSVLTDLEIETGLKKFREIVN